MRYNQCAELAGLRKPALFQRVPAETTLRKHAKTEDHQCKAHHWPAGIGLVRLDAHVWSQITDHAWRGAQPFVLSGLAAAVQFAGHAQSYRGVSWDTIAKL